MKKTTVISLMTNAVVLPVVGALLLVGGFREGTDDGRDVEGRDSLTYYVEHYDCWTGGSGHPIPGHVIIDGKYLGEPHVTRALKNYTNTPGLNAFCP